MKLVCPSCGCYGPVDVFLADLELARAVMAALSVPAALAAPMQQYLRLFRPAQRALTARRIETLLGELAPMIAAGAIERRGRTWPAPVEYWRAGIEEMLEHRDRLTLPLKSHGYLLEIIAGLAHRAETQAEAKSEADKRYPYAGERQNAPGPLGQYAPVGGVAPPREIPPEARKMMNRIMGKTDGDA